MRQFIKTRKDEKAFVIPMMALVMGVLIVIAGFAVDLGQWYLQATKLQRASDVAALSAASSLPNTTEAMEVARTTYAKNGFSNGGSITITTTANESEVTTTAKNSKVPTYFLRMLFPSISIQRSSSAVKQSAVPLGNPYNIFGSGTLDVGPGAPPQRFWAAISGICASREDGDLFASRFDANKTADSHICNAPASKRNPYYREGGFNGYSYIIDVPAGAGPTSIDIYDAQYHGKGSADGHAAGDVSMSMTGDGESMDMSTSFAIYDTKLTSEEADDGAALNARRFEDGTSDGRATWINMYKEPPGTVGVRQYKLQVFFDDNADNRDGESSNTYAVMASVNGDKKGCDTRKNPTTCPKVYGLGAVSVYNNISSAGNNQSAFYLAELRPEFAGSTYDAFMWDPGEGAEKIELLAPNGTVVPFTWTISPTTNLAGPSTGTGTSLDVSGDGPQPTSGLSGTSKYNDRLLTMRFTVPVDYASLYDANSNDYWWQIRYTVKSGAQVTDRTTFGLKAASSTPPHLSK